MSKKKHVSIIELITTIVVSSAKLGMNAIKKGVEKQFQLANIITNKSHLVLLGSVCLKIHLPLTSSALLVVVSILDNLYWFFGNSLEFSLYIEFLSDYSSLSCEF